MASLEPHAGPDQGVDAFDAAATERAWPANLDGAAAQRWLLAHGHLLKDADRQSFGELLAIVQTIERVSEPLRLRIIQANRSERFAALTGLLQSVPGIGEVWACIIAAEIGDFARFPNADALTFWAGLTPDLKESAGRTTSGNITKCGSRTLRWALGKAAGCLCRSDAAQERVRQRLIARCGGSKAKANVAMARRLACILFAMARTGEAYRVGEPTAAPPRPIVSDSTSVTNKGAPPKKPPPETPSNERSHTALDGTTATCLTQPSHVASLR